jgi:hypothetical protein
LQAEGNVVRGVEVNGKPGTEPFVSGRLPGEQNLTILLGRHAPARTMPIRPGAMSPSPRAQPAQDDTGW